jgi:hypothetical protein
METESPAPDEFAWRDGSGRALFNGKKENGFGIVAWMIRVDYWNFQRRDGEEVEGVRLRRGASQEEVAAAAQRAFDKLDRRRGQE